MRVRLSCVTAGGWRRTRLKNFLQPGNVFLENTNDREKKKRDLVILVVKVYFICASFSELDNMQNF